MKTKITIQTLLKKTSIMKKITISRNILSVMTIALFMLLTCKTYAQNYTQDFFSILPGSTNNTIDVADFNGDGAMDLFLTGQLNSSPHLGDILLNDGTGVFNNVSNIIAAVRFSGVAIGDLNGNSHLDLVVLGQDDLSSPIESTKIYINDGSGNFTLSSTHNMIQLRAGDVAIADIDGDGDLDIIITGWDGSGRVIELHKNNGSGTFTRVQGTNFTPVTNAALRFGDVDGDGDVDLLLVGDIGGSDEVTELYLNDGSGNFTLSSNSFTGVKRGDAGFVDVDGDGDLDIIITGINDGQSIGAVTELYLNDGSGNFALDVTATFIQLSASSVDFGDIDNDGDIDILFTGKDDNGSGVAETLLYKNDGSGNFTLHTTAITGFRSGDGKLVDIDGDGDLDVVVSGWDESGRTMEIWRSDASLNVEDEKLDMIKIYPNPTKDIVHIPSRQNETYNIEVFDILGKIVMEIKNENVIDISKLKQGTYFLKLHSEESVLVKTIIKY